MWEGKGGIVVAKPRVVETNVGIQGEWTVELFDRFAQGMRDKGYNNVDGIVKSGILEGRVLEIGPGPGYVGLEWLKKRPGASLTGLEISPDMIRMAEKNAAAYGLSGRAAYVQGNCMQLPFPDASFDAAFSNGSLHEWEEPVRVFDEIFRVLKPGGRYFIADLRRDVNPLILRLIHSRTEPREIRPGLLTSVNAAYTAKELRALAARSRLRDAAVRREFFGLTLSGRKA